jgi:hypothetical protein
MEGMDNVTAFIINLTVSWVWCMIGVYRLTVYLDKGYR